MEKNPYVLQSMQRIMSDAFGVIFTNLNFPEEQFRFIYRYGPNQRINYYNLDMTEVTVDVATWLRDAMNHVFNETEEA